MTTDNSDPVLPVLEKIKKFADEQSENPEGEKALALAYCLRYVFAHMERKNFDDAPLIGPEVDQYESQAVKFERVKVSSAIDSYIKSGMLK